MLFLFTSEVYAFGVLGVGLHSCGKYVLDFENFYNNNIDLDKIVPLWI